MMIANGIVERLVDTIDSAPWSQVAGRTGVVAGARRPALYTPEQRRRRDRSIWTMVQCVLVPVHAMAVLVAALLVLQELIGGVALSGTPVAVTAVGVLLTGVLITGSLWERSVFGRYLFARPFVWEDAGSVVVLLLHASAVAGVLSEGLSVEARGCLALLAFAAYAFNAMLFRLKMQF